MMNRNIIIGLFLLLLSAYNNKVPTTPIKIKERIFPTCEYMEIKDSFQIPQVFKLICWELKDSTVSFVSMDEMDDFVVTYRLPSCQKKISGGHIGQGPGEFVTVNGGQAMNHNLLLYDIMGRKLRIFDASGDSLQMLRAWPLYNDEEGMCKPFTFISQLSDHTFLMKVDYPYASWWEIADLTTSTVLDSLPNPHRNPEKRSYVHCNFKQCVADTVLVAAYAYTDCIDYYSLADNRITPLFSLGRFVDRSNIPDYPVSMRCYLDVASCGQYFYCLKSSKGAASGNRVEVYDFSGTCRQLYQLPTEVSSIRIDQEGNVWGYREADDCTTLYKFQIQ